MTVTPGTCLNGGTVVTITGSGFDASSLGIVLQCNSDASQPTVTFSVLGTPETLPISCSALALSRAVQTRPDGTIPTVADGGKATTFTVVAGTTGAPCGATGDLQPVCPADSTGGNTVNDAANYPCPPTAAEVAAGVGPCVITFADQGGARVSVPITYVPPAQLATGGGTTTTTAPATAASTTPAATAGATPAAAAPKTAASSGSLAFTGPGTGLYIIGAAGFIMVLLGAAILGLSGAPGSLALALRRRRQSS
jgi:hypothetical protein